MDERDELEQEPGGLVPPYEGRQEEGPGAAGEEKAFHPEAAGPPGPGREISEEEREGVPSTDTSAESPLGVGVSTTRRAEDIARREDEPGRETTGVKGESERPVGESSQRDSTGVGPQDPGEDSPNLPAGDQGG
ncbi:MAG TPA: hypothetical protein VFL71_20115 [Actinomycetes bacterium]|jgi:hypothetical protein|nr:hypothetical protein [Actinomycetes bacterium]